MFSTGQSTVSAKPVIAPPGVGLRFELEAVLADVRQLVEADDAPGLAAGLAADARNQRVLAGEP